MPPWSLWGQLRSCNQGFENLLNNEFVFFSIKVSQYTFIMAAFKEAKSVAHESMVLDGYTVDYCEVKQGKYGCLSVFYELLQWILLSTDWDGMGCKDVMSPGYVNC